MIVNLYFVLDHILSSEIPSYFSDQYAHAGVDSAYIANNKPDLNVSMCTNGSSGSSGNSGSSLQGLVDRQQAIHDGIGSGQEMVDAARASSS